MTARDAPRVAPLDLAAARTFLDREWETVARSWTAEVSFARRELALGAYDGDALVGVAKGHLRAGVGHLSELVTGASHRGRAGVGTALLRAWEALCRREGCHKLTLSTVAGERAESFYRARGWVVEATLHDDKARLDWSLMAKWLSD